MELQVKQVPYGVADFAMVIEQNLYYVDKTMFIPELESSLAISSSSALVVLVRAYS